MNLAHGNICDGMGNGSSVCSVLTSSGGTPMSYLIDEDDGDFMDKREAISKKTRFEVFKRDSFTCQYCGEKAPDVILHIDHIISVKNGGKNGITNLITSCIGCNLGKGARSLTDNATITKQRKQLEDINERRIQLEMMAQWKTGLDNLEAQKIENIVNVIQDNFSYNGKYPYILNDYARSEIRKWIKKYSLEQIYDGIDSSITSYIRFENGVPSEESRSKAFHYISRICNVKKNSAEKPYMADVYYIRGILRNRLSYINDKILIPELDYAFHQYNVNPDYIKNVAKQVNSWTSFWNILLETIQEAKEGK